VAEVRKDKRFVRDLCFLFLRGGVTEIIHWMRAACHRTNCSVRARASGRNSRWVRQGLTRGRRGNRRAPLTQTRGAGECVTVYSESPADESYRPDDGMSDAHRYTEATETSEITEVKLAKREVDRFAQRTVPRNRPARPRVRSAAEHERPLWRPK